MISDFGISRILINSITVAGTSNLKGNTRWLSVELIDPRMRPDSSSHQFHTKQTDVWAFGMVVYVSIYTFFVTLAVS
jgi:serine/threonine protein kinase